MASRSQPASSDTSSWRGVVDATLQHPHTGEEFELISRDVLPAARPGFLTRGDLGALSRLGLYAAAARFLDPQYWASVAAAVPHRRKRSACRRMEAAMRVFFGEKRNAAELTMISANHRQAEARRLMLTAIEAVATWQPQISIAHLDRLDAALRRGRGAILWCDSFLFESLLGKRALFEAGFAGHQVSVTEHGYSRSRFGRWAINSLQQRQELRYLSGRLAFEREDSALISRQIVAALRRRSLVLITNNTYAGHRFISMPFGASGRLRLATGPLRLARICQAPLMPFAIFEVEPFRRYQAIIGEEIGIAGGTAEDDRRGQLALIDALTSYRSWLEAHLLRYPNQWMRWQTLAPSHGGGGDIP
jgi:lauroyl/myristoyl acyltransferase